VIDDRAEQRAVDVHTGVEAAVLEHRLSGVGATDGVPVDADASAAQAAGASHGVEVRDDVTLVGDALHERPLAPVLPDRVRGHQLAAADIDDLGVTDMVDTDDNEAAARQLGRRGDVEGRRCGGGR
jgi:hypothetical protein